ncbi:hypothetical protein IMCC9480_2842 [Oxalobacteraceae bacterium IMCC9480]|nr:hypothetical protein IMCC9480_2842 [Oxalobacteraceae bacterium IMCC9480]
MLKRVLTSTNIWQSCTGKTVSEIAETHPKTQAHCRTNALSA